MNGTNFVTQKSDNDDPVTEMTMKNQNEYDHDESNDENLMARNDDSKNPPLFQKLYLWIKLS